MQTADFTIAEFRDWAKTKPADERYNYCNAFQCAVGQFGEETGREYLVGVGDLKTDHRELYELVNPSFVGPNNIQWDISSTFGALVERINAVLPAEPLSDTWTKADAYLTDIEDVARERCSA